MSWLAAMQQMKVCEDRRVLAAHKDELDELKSVQPQIGVSKAFTLKGQGRIPIQLGGVTQEKVHGWVRVEAAKYPNIGLPLLFEPTLCHAGHLFIEASTPLAGSVKLPKQTVIVTITPIIRAPTVQASELVPTDEEESHAGHK